MIDHWYIVKFIAVVAVLAAMAGLRFDCCRRMTDQTVTQCVYDVGCY